MVLVSLSQTTGASLCKMLIFLVIRRFGKTNKRGKFLLGHQLTFAFSLVQISALCCMPNQSLVSVVPVSD